MYFMIGLIGNPKLCIKFEIASFSHCKNIKGKLANLWELLDESQVYTFVFRGDFIIELGKPEACTKSYVARPTCIFRYYRNIKMDPKF